MSKHKFICHVTGGEVRPLGIGTPETVGGMRYAWWTCPSCDRNERRRNDVGFDATIPGVHVVSFGPVRARPMWPLSRWPGKRVLV